MGDLEKDVIWVVNGGRGQRVRLDGVVEMSDF